MLLAALCLFALPNGEIAYMHQGGVWLVRPDGTGKEFAAQGSYDRPLVWSPDGSKLVFWKEDRAWNLFSYAPATGKVDDLTRARTADNRVPSFSPDGTWIAYMSGEKGLCLVDSEGRQIRNLTSKGHRDSPPQWLGQDSLAFEHLTSDGKIESYEIATSGGSPKLREPSRCFRTQRGSRWGQIRRGSPAVFEYGEWGVAGSRRLTLGDVQSADFAWASQGDAIAYRTYAPSEALYVRRLADTASRKVADLAPNAWCGYSFSPDGKRIVFSNGPRDATGIFVVAVAGGKPRRIADGVWPAWRPIPESG
jgi:Tol biopolymer transport system component